MMWKVDGVLRVASAAAVCPGGMVGTWHTTCDASWGDNMVACLI